MEKRRLENFLLDLDGVTGLQGNIWLLAIGDGVYADNRRDRLAAGNLPREDDVVGLRERRKPPRERKRFDEFTFGYCLTVHKAQGSQWDKVYLFDESFVFREDRRRWLYTGVTRASEQITVVM